MMPNARGLTGQAGKQLKDCLGTLSGLAGYITSYPESYKGLYGFLGILKFKNN